MKIGIATVHDSSNLGSFLQALAMQELVKKHGDTPYIIKTRSSFTTLLLYLGYNNSKGARSIKSFARFFISCLKNPFEIVTRYKKYKNYKKDWSYFENIISVKQSNKMGLDILLLGSDEIWNSNQPAFRNLLLYGEGISAHKKYAYAVSVGDMNDDNWVKYPYLLDAIKKLDGIAVRDFATRDILLANKVKTDIKIADPTLQTNIKEYMSNEPLTTNNSEYIAVYSYGINKNIKNHIIRFAKKNGLKTVAISLPQDWCDEYINCSPLEFGSVLTSAKYVYTATFHGTIFSILYHTRFVSLPLKNKVREVLTLLGASSAAIDDNISYEDFEKKLDNSLDYDKIDETICNLHHESFDIYERLIKEK